MGLWKEEYSLREPDLRQRQIELSSSWISLLIKLFLMDFSGGSGFLFSKTGIRVGEE